METRINVGDPQAIRNYSTRLAVDVAKSMWWTQFIGSEDTAIVQEKMDLKSHPGDTVQFDLNMQLRGDGVYGDDVAEGKEESLAFLIDEVKIDQIRKPISAGSRMSQKRTLHDLRKLVKDRGRDWIAKWQDEVMFAYASGLAPGDASNEDAVFGASAFAANPIEAPDAGHLVYGGDATAKGNLDASDTIKLDLVRVLAVRAQMLKARNPELVDLNPGDFGGEQAYVFVMSPDQGLALKRATATNEWADIQKNAAPRGKSNPVFGTELGRLDGVVMKTHKNVRRMNDYGSGGNVEAARALFLGRQALTVAYGSGNGTRMIWEEDQRDYKNNFSVAVGMIFGAKKTRFKPKTGGAGSDFGIISVDTAAAAA